MDTIFSVFPPKRKPAFLYTVANAFHALRARIDAPNYFILCIFP